MKNNKNHNAVSKKMSKLNETERTLLSIILMHKGAIDGARLKRIFLDRFTFWELQAVQNELQKMGILKRLTEGETNGHVEYRIPPKYIDELSELFLSKPLEPVIPDRVNNTPSSCCLEYSILWYLWRLDAVSGSLLFSGKHKKGSKRGGVKRLDETLGIDRRATDFLSHVLEGLSSSKFLEKNGYKRWSDVLDSPSEFIKIVFMIVADSLYKSGELGRDDVGFDNMDFLFTELAALQKGEWYSFSAFVENLRGTLFLCSQPFRWIHMTHDKVWELLELQLAILGIVETKTGSKGARYFRVSNLGAYCLGSISLEELEEESSQRVGTFLVHPNFEITLVLSETSPRVLLELAMFSHPDKIDTMSVFKITRESIKEGERMGLTTEEMVSFLKENSRGEVPQNVDYSIRDWGS